MTRRKVAALVGLIAMAMLLVGVPAQAKAPLRPYAETQFDLGWSGSPDEPDWVGTVTIADVVYGAAFFNTGTGKSAHFPVDPVAGHPSGNLFFEETWVIYAPGTLHFSFDNGVLTSFDPPGDEHIVLSGYQSGVSVMTNGTFRMNGTVDVAEGEFSHWLGRRVHGNGEFQFEFTDDGAIAAVFSSGPFRIN